MLLDIMNFCYSFGIALLLGHVLISWVPSLRNNPLGAWVYGASERMLAPVRRLLRPISIGGGASLDLSPLMAYILLSFIFVVLKGIVKALV